MLIRDTARVVVLLSVLAAPAGAQQPDAPPQGLIPEPDIVERAVVFADRRLGNSQNVSGLRWDVWNMAPGAGWLSAGPGYRRWYSKDRVFFDASAGLSWGGYKTTQARVELPRMLRSRLALASEFRWLDFTHVRFFGEGAESRLSDLGEYRIKSHDLVGEVAYKPAEWARIAVQAGRLQPTILPRGGWFEGDRPDVREVFPADPVFATIDQPSFLHTETSFAVDTRDEPRHLTRGGLYRVAVANYAASGDSAFGFKRYEAEAVHAHPVVPSRLVIALHGWLVASDPGEGGTVPFYLQPSLGGANTLRSYADYRFHDRNMLAVNVEARLAVMTHMDIAAFVDAGNVAPRVRGLNLNRRSFGAGLRMHTRAQTLARVDVARGDEGWRLLFRLSDPLDLVRLSRRVASAPFVP